jgi:serine/threonine-protein kinase HipA
MGWKISEGRIDRLIAFATVDGQPVPMGALTFEGGGRRRQSVFRYAASWLARRDKWPVAPVHLPLRNKAAHSIPYEVPLPFYDTAPDGWGRQVLTMAFPNQVFGLGEFIAAAGDDRIGDLRFGPSPEAGPEQWRPDEPLLDLPDGADDLAALQAAAEAVDEGQPSRRHLQLLFRSSADIGGARPKTRIRRGDGYWIAKFRAQGDAFDNARVEAACLTLAQACGIAVPEHDVVDVAGRAVLLVKRFDRAPDEQRLGYMSAATLVGAEPTVYATDISYAEIAAKARSVGVRPCEAELYRRLLFYTAIHNTDDHLRNHAFLRENGEWRLSPAFDIVPCPGRRLVLRPAPGFDPVPDPAVAAAAYESFKLSREQAGEILDKVQSGFRRLPEALARWEVSQRDQEILAQFVPGMRSAVSVALPPARPRR